MTGIVKKEKLGESWSIRPDSSLETKMEAFRKKNKCLKADVLRTALVAFFNK